MWKTHTRRNLLPVLWQVAALLQDLRRQDIQQSPVLPGVRGADIRGAKRGDISRTHLMGMVAAAHLLGFARWYHWLDP